MGANQAVAEERKRARRQLRADRPHRRRPAGLFDEVREFARACAGITATAGRSRTCSACAAGSSSQRNFRMVPGSEAAGRIGFFSAGISETEKEARRERVQPIWLCWRMQKTLELSVGRNSRAQDTDGPLRAGLTAAIAFQRILHMQITGT